MYIKEVTEDLKVNAYLNVKGTENQFFFYSSQLYFTGARWESLAALSTVPLGGWTRSMEAQVLERTRLHKFRYGANF